MANYQDSTKATSQPQPTLVSQPQTTVTHQIDLARASSPNINRDNDEISIALHSNSPRAQVAAIQVLAKSKTETATELIANRACQDPEPYVRTAAMIHLQANQSDQAYDALVQGLTDVNPKVRWAAVSSLRGTTDSASINAIVAYSLGDPDQTVRQAALKTLLQSQSTGKVLRNTDLHAVADNIARRIQAQDGIE